jgi:hypothetical protein
MYIIKENHTMKAQLKKTAMAICASVLLSSGVAMADGWPASVTGNWAVLGNQSAGGLNITQFAGAAGSQCKPIRGTIYGVDGIEGFYCPGSGRIAFMRYNGNTTNPKQHWIGNLSQAVAGQPLRMGGTFTATDHNNVFGTSGGSLGEYNFHATK